MAGPLKYDQFLLEVSEDCELVARYTQAGKAGELIANGVLDLKNQEDFVNKCIKDLISSKLDDEDKSKFGEVMYGILFRGEIGHLIETAINGINLTQGKGLRLIIRFPFNNEIAKWPLEFLRRPIKGWLSTHSSLTLSRQILCDIPPFPSIETEDLDKLRVLLIASQPNGKEGVMVGSILEGIQKKEEYEKGSDSHGMEIRLLGEVEEFQVSNSIEYLHKKATFDNLFEQVHWQPHVVHFIGHGGYDNITSYLLLVNPDGKEVKVTADELGQLIEQMRPMLVILQACDTAHPSIPTQQTHDSFLNLASRLAQVGIPAVVAMQFEIRSDYAQEFATELYYYLKHGYEIDAAVQEGRVRICRYEDQTGNPLRWAGKTFGTPVLYMLKPIGIFRTRTIDGKKKIVIPIDYSLFDKPTPAREIALRLERLVECALDAAQPDLAEIFTDLKNIYSKIRIQGAGGKEQVDVDFGNKIYELTKNELVQDQPAIVEELTGLLMMYIRMSTKLSPRVGDTSSPDSKLSV